jgi:pSer/pThr/pTyr-binding forkhead associated (FHA) protein
MNIKLLNIDGETPDFEVSPDESPVRIGRHWDVEVRVVDRWVSRFHCEVDQFDGSLWVRDLDSTHGTFVNGFQITQAPLAPGDRLTVGMTSFRVEYDPQPSRNPAAGRAAVSSSK